MKVDENSDKVTIVEANIYTWKLLLFWPRIPFIAIVNDPSTALSSRKEVANLAGGN